MFTSLTGRLNTVLLLLVLLALVTIIAMLASGVRGGPLDPPGPVGSTASVRLPGTPISSGPTTITQPGHYYLTNNINVSGAVNAIVIGANNVSLDLGGFTIAGTDTAGSTGILTTSTFSVRIENGTVQDFHGGVNTGTAERSRIEGVDAVSNIRGFEVGSRSVVSDCQAIANTETGIVITGFKSIVRECLVIDNDLDGIAVLGVRNSIERTRVFSESFEPDIHLQPGGVATTISQNRFSYLRIESSANVVANNVCDGVNFLHIWDLSAPEDYIAPATSPHANFTCIIEPPL